MEVLFWKFHGNGNDFIIIENLELAVVLSSDTIRALCDRHFGIGADGLLELRKSAIADFEMVYYNADGKKASMCGNGARCIAAFAFQTGITGRQMQFMAYDGIHHAQINKGDRRDDELLVTISMSDVVEVQKNPKYYFLDTGSPHYVEFVDRVAEIDVNREGSKTRYSEKFSPAGTNVNFVEINEERIFVRTYERGVENETLSCGTGVIASSIAAFLETGKKNMKIHTTGGDFETEFDLKDNKFCSVKLRGATKRVFEGRIKL